MSQKNRRFLCLQFSQKSSKLFLGPLKAAASFSLVVLSDMLSINFHPNSETYEKLPEDSSVKSFPKTICPSMLCFCEQYFKVVILFDLLEASSQIWLF